MVSLPSVLRRRHLCTQVTQQHNSTRRRQKWTVKQVMKSNFDETLDQVKTHISSSDFIAVSLRNTGIYSSPWHRVSVFDTADTAYFKAKYAAERFQILQFSLCPFSFSSSKVIAYPYNFHLFPRDELKVGLPAYSFSCDASYLKHMAREGFDFNSCIYDGISYLSRAQEYEARVRLRSPALGKLVEKSVSAPTLADRIFAERVKSRVKHWRNASKKPDSSSDEVMVRSLRNIILGGGEYGLRPSMTIDVCSDRQVQLVLEMLEEYADDLVPLVIPAKGGGIEAVRVVLTSSVEDKVKLEKELQNNVEEENRKVRGFREVVDFISSSKKPVICYNALNDFSFIYSKFLAPLPSRMDEFLSSLRLDFPQVIDVNHLMTKNDSLRGVPSISKALTLLKNQKCTSIEMGIPPEGTETEAKIHGHSAVNICKLFVKLCHKLRIFPSAVGPSDVTLASALEAYANIFSSSSAGPLDPEDGDVKMVRSSTTKVSCEDMVFLWGFSGYTTAQMLRSLLQKSHEVFSERFDVRSVERSCAVVAFHQPGLARIFLEVMNDNNGSDIGGPLRGMVSEGLRATGYNTYTRVCRSGLWKATLADSLDKALQNPHHCSESDSTTMSTESYSCNELVINLDQL